MFPHRSRGGLRCFVPDGTGQRVAQRLNEFSDGVDFNLFWLVLCRPYGAWGYLADVSPPLPLHFVQGERGGLRCFVPDGTGQRVAQPLNEFSDGVDFNLFWLILRALTGLGDTSRMFPHRFPFTSFRPSAVGYVVSFLTGLAKGW